MKPLVLISALSLLLAACNNDKKPAATGNTTRTNTESTTTTSTPADPATNDYKPAMNLTYTADGVEISNGASILVSKDKDKLKAGAPYMCMLTSNGAKNNNEYLTLNFLLDTKPGSYPVVGAGFNRGKDNAAEMYGAILGGKPQLTDYKVNITECKDLGSNNMGGHKWSISGTWEGITLKAMPIMLMDKSKNHPAEAKLEKGSFSNLTFDDNWEEMMNNMMKKK